MATKTPVRTDKAPAPPSPGIYSQAIVAGGVVYCSGAVAIDAATGKLIDGDVKAHTVFPLFCLYEFDFVVTRLPLTTPTAPMHQEPVSYPRSRRLGPHQGRQG